MVTAERPQHATAPPSGYASVSDTCGGFSATTTRGRTGCPRAAPDPSGPRTTPRRRQPSSGRTRTTRTSTPRTRSPSRGRLSTGATRRRGCDPTCTWLRVRAPWGEAPRGREHGTAGAGVQPVAARAPARAARAYSASPRRCRRLLLGAPRNAPHLPRRGVRHGRAGVQRRGRGGRHAHRHLQFRVRVVRRRARLRGAPHPLRASPRRCCVRALVGRRGAFANSCACCEGDGCREMCSRGRLWCACVCSAGGSPAPSAKARVVCARRPFQPLSMLLSSHFRWPRSSRRRKQRVLRTRPHRRLCHVGRCYDERARVQVEFEVRPRSRTE